jgi:O-antigen biosynthesis protein
MAVGRLGRYRAEEVRSAMPHKRKASPTRRHSQYQSGYELGYREGWSKGKEAYGRSFEGTSIIIPTYNQKEYLRKCIESIRQHTHSPYELIVVDNGSRDGTASYLRSLRGKVRVRYNPVNMGFAGGVNQGLMMAKGTSIVILNNDTLVTHNWLSNLLACLKSDSRIGLAGPVTNNISGEQRVRASYKNMRQMQRFARSYNRPDPARWRRSNGIMGFCLILTGETLRKVGYFDERFAIGTCEDVDYYLRIRLLGLDLVIAEDTFIHHYGSVTMRSFKDAAAANNTLFLDKWGGWDSLDRMESVMGSDFRSNGIRRMTDFYPSHALVEAAGQALYWVEDGVRYPVEGGREKGLEGVRVSRMELRNWTTGGRISPEEVLHKLEALQVHQGELVEGETVRTPDGSIYQYKRRHLRRFAGSRAFEEWNRPARTVRDITEVAKNRYPEGLPIIAAPVLKANHL